MTTVDDTLAARPGTGLRARPDALPIVLLGALLVATFATIVLTTRDYVLYADDWAILELRYQGGIRSLLEPYNGHLMAVSVFAFKVLARVAGLDVHWPYMAVLAAGHVAAVTGVFVLVRRRLAAWPALFLTAPLAILGAAWESLLWPASLNFVMFLAASVWAWVALDRGDRRGDVAALLLTLLATFSSGAAPCLHLALAAELALARRWRSMWIPGIPFAAFVVWLVVYGNGGDRTTVDKVLQMPQFAAEMLATAAGAVIGQPQTFGYTLVLLLAVAIGWVAMRRPDLVTPRAVGVLVALLAFVALTGAVRGGETGATSSRYVEIGAPLLVLLLAELGRRVRLDRPALTALGVVALIAVVGNIGLMSAGNAKFRGLNQEVAARMGAFDLVPDTAPEDFNLAPGLGYEPIAGRYRKLMRLTGDTGGPSPREMFELNANARVQGDAMMVQLAVRSEPVPRPTGCAPAVPGPQPHAPGEALIVRATTAGASVRVRRFGPPSSGTPVAVPAGTAQRIRFAADDARDVPYVIEIQGAGAARCSGRG